MFCKLDVCVTNLRGTMPPPSFELRDHRNTIRKYCNIIKITTAGWMKREIKHEATPDKLIKEKSHQR